MEIAGSEPIRKLKLREHPNNFIMNCETLNVIHQSVISIITTVFEKMITRFQFSSYLLIVYRNVHNPMKYILKRKKFAILKMRILRRKTLILYTFWVVKYRIKLLEPVQLRILIEI